MAKGNINVDNIPDATDAPGPLLTNYPPVSSSPNSLDMSNLLSNPYNVTNPFMPFTPTSSGSTDPLQSNLKKMYEDSFKKYMEELKTAGAPTGASTDVAQGQSSKSSHESGEETPLDLSKPLRMGGVGKHNLIDTSELTEASDMNMSRCEETQSESCSEPHDDSILSSNPPSPLSSTTSSVINTLTHSGISPSPSLAQIQKHNMQMSPSKRFRTQMTSQQIKIMKNIFVDYKTPTMAECDMLGREIGLQKRVVQVWFQNARAKEKKAKLTYAKTFGTDMDLARPPDECKLCSFKYTHKYTIQDHIFTRRHIENVSKLIQLQSDGPKDYIDPETMNNLLRQRESTSDTQWKNSDAIVSSHPHLAHLQAMGIQAMGM